jgi:hypothetical protein
VRHSKNRSSNVRFGSKADIVGYQRNVRFTPKSGHQLSQSGCPLCAINGHCAIYSITSSARPSKVVGPPAVAAGGDDFGIIASNLAQYGGFPL